MLVELKSGETYNGHLEAVDSWMNIKLRDVICTSKDGERFWRMAECYIRGAQIKYLRVPDEVLEHVKEDLMARGRERQSEGGAQHAGAAGGPSGGRGRGGRGGSGGGRGGRGGGGGGQQPPRGHGGPHPHRGGRGGSVRT